MKVVILVAGVVVFLTPMAFGQELPSLKEIRAHLETQLLTLDPIAVEFTTVSQRPPGLPSHLPWADKPHQWTWTKSGSRERLVMDEQFYEKPGTYMNHDVSIDNGVLTRLTFSGKGSNTVAHVTRTDKTVEFGDPLSPLQFLGLRLQACDESILDILVARHADIGGWSHIDDDPCVHVVVKELKNAFGMVGRWEFHLSAAHGYLPRRITHEFVVKRPKVPSDPKSELVETSALKVYEVTSYHRLSDSEPDHGHFFPSQATLVVNDLKMTLTVNKVTLGSDALPTMKSVSLPRGVVVDTIRDGRPVKRELSGSNAVQDAK